MEGSRGDEAIGIERCLSNTKQNRCEFGRRSTRDRHRLIGIFHLAKFDQLSGEKRGIPSILDPNFAGHLANNHLNVLVVNRHSLRLVDVLDFGHKAMLKLGNRFLSRVH